MEHHGNNRLSLKKDYVSNRRTRLSYDDEGNVIGVTATSGASADGGAMLLEKEVVDTYSANGTLVRVNGTDPVEQLVHYDDNGQVTGLSAKGEMTVTYTFDEFGRLTARNLATDTARNAAVTYYGVSGNHDQFGIRTRNRPLCFYPVFLCFYPVFLGGSL